MRHHPRAKLPHNMLLAALETVMPSTATTKKDDMSVPNKDVKPTPRNSCALLTRPRRIHRPRCCSLGARERHRKGRGSAAWLETVHILFLLLYRFLKYNTRELRREQTLPIEHRKAGSVHRTLATGVLRESSTAWMEAGGAMRAPPLSLRKITLYLARSSAATG